MQDFATRRTMMVDTQVRPNDVTKFPIIEAMLHVPREEFVPPARREAAYIGENVEIAPGRVLMEPRNFAKLLDFLDIQPSDLVLDIGCGLGYSAAVDRADGRGGRRAGRRADGGAGRGRAGAGWGRQCGGGCGRADRGGRQAWPL